MVVIAMAVGIVVVVVVCPHAASVPQPLWQAVGMPNLLERWQADAGDADIAILDIPPALRARRFHVDVQFMVRCPTDAARP